MKRLRKHFSQGRWFDHLIILGVLVLFGLGLFGGVRKLGGGDAKVIRVVTALLPPQMDAGGKGREADIIIAAMRAGGIDPAIRFEFHVLPFTRHWQAFKADNQRARYDLVTTVPDEIDLGGLLSERYIQYQNGVIYRADRFPAGLGETPGEVLASLSGKRVVAFAGAAVILNGVRRVSEQAFIYRERRAQRSHSVMFANGEADAVIAEELIFAYYTREILGGDYAAFAPKMAFDPVFCPTPYHLVFRQEKYRDAFNAGLKTIRANGTLDAIERRYAAAGAMPRSTKIKQTRECN
jgi:polar amino acid transport system substrate-binding protein